MEKTKKKQPTPLQSGRGMVVLERYWTRVSYPYDRPRGAGYETLATNQRQLMRQPSIYHPLMLSPMFRAHKALLLAFFLALMALSCEKSGEISENGAYPAEENTAGIVAALTDTSMGTNTGSAGAISPQANREVVLIRGNYWVSGISGFGDNSFAALTGVYRFDDASNQITAGDRKFAVYITMEPLYFTGEWQKRPGTGTIPAFQRAEGEEFFVAAAPEDGNKVSASVADASWTAVFRFPHGLTGAGFSDTVFNQMLRIWTGRFSYFLSLSNTTGEISLPAVVEF